MAELIPTLTSIAAVVCFVFALLARRRQLETQALLTDAALRLENAQKQSRHFEQSAKTQQDQFERLRAQAGQMEKSLEESKARLSDRTVEWNKLKEERDAISERATLQRDHLDEQVQVLTQQLSEAIREKKSAIEDMQKLQKEIGEKANQQADILRNQLKETQQSLQAVRREKGQLEAQFEKLKEQSGLVKPEELKRYKLKVLRLEQLYTSMRGLREMAEERNRNWETALRSFAEYILEVPMAAANRPPLGPLVGAALEKIGVQLVDDNAADPHAEATSDSSLSDLDASLHNTVASDDLMPVQL